MKIHFGFANPDTIDKLSPALQAKDINLLKAAPCQIPLKGLHRIEQPGYSEYASHLSAFLYANDQKKRVPIGREGYPITIGVDRLIPLSVPSISVSYKNRDIPKAIKDFTVVREITAKEKSLKTYLVEYKPGLFGILNASGFEKGQFPIANSVSADDLRYLIVILRIFSSFLHTHKYPAFTTEEDFEYEFEGRIELGKRDLQEAEYEQDDDGSPVKKMIAVEIDGQPTWVKPEGNIASAEVKLRYAKPGDNDSVKAWGSTSDIPVTDGIVFPFIDELAIWDKDTVCSVVGLYFVRCLGHTTDGCLQGYSELCQAWKRSLHRTSLGNVLSHIAKVIGVAIPAQARVYPVIESGRYTGSYLSGAGYSVGLKGEILRPTSYTANQEDFDVFDGTEAILRKIAGTFQGDKDENYKKLIQKKGNISMRGLQQYLDTWVMTPEKWERIRTMASFLVYPQEYYRINMDNIRLVLSWIKGEPIPLTAPMHSHGLGKTSIYERAFSAFGPNAPSPMIPGAPKIQLTEKPPNNFSKGISFRTTALENAISEWKECGAKGYTYNGADRLSAKYQYVPVKGDAERKVWFDTMHSFHLWCKSTSAGMLGEVVANEDDNGSGGVSVGDQSVQFEGF
jgi:hypothetical protein